MEFNALSVEFLSTVAVGLGAVAVWLRKQRTGLAKDSLDIAVSESNVSAQTAIHSVIGLLRDEVARLTLTNNGLSQQLANYQTANIQMQMEISILKASNTNLHGDITELKDQLDKLSALVGSSGDCESCPKKNTCHSFQAFKEKMDLDL